VPPAFNPPENPMARLAALLLTLITILPLPAMGDARFDAAAAKAERLEDLRVFLGRYIGSCADPIERRTCEANVAAFRKSAGGKTMVVRVTDAAALVRAQPKGERVLLLLTPFIDGGGYALTRGAPTRQDAAGNPLVDFVPMEVALPPGVLEMEFLSPFRAGAIELEIVFRPDRAWKLKRKGEPGWFEGLAARFLSLRVINARDGSEIAAKSW
jgi:hypothetical protein